jgi:AbrB family looped-hinge helix DNA binding protein
MLSYFRLTNFLPRTNTMDTTRLSSKGQLVLPKAIRDAGDWAEGTEFMVERVSEGVLLRPVRPFPVTRLEDVIGCAGYRGPARSIADMERAIAKGVKARRARGRY